MKWLDKLGKRGRIAVWFGAVAFFFLVISLSVYGIFSMTVSKDRDRGTLVYKHGTGSRRDASYEVPRELYCPDGVYYVDFSTVAKGCDLSVSGDENEIRYLIPTEGDYDTVTFYYGSREISVNGNHFMLSAKVVKQGASILVPAEFISLCMNGVTVETSKNTITVIYDVDAVSLKPSFDPIEKPNV